MSDKYTKKCSNEYMYFYNDRRYYEGQVKTDIDLRRSIIASHLKQACIELAEKKLKLIDYKDDRDLLVRALAQAALATLSIYTESNYLMKEKK